MLRLIAIISFVALLGACDSGNKTAAAQTSAADKPAAQHDDHKRDSKCTCGEGKKGGSVWCDKCGVGYVNGKKVANKAEVDKALKN